MAACGIGEETTPTMNSTEFYTAHEALHLGYEEKLTRLDSTTEEFCGAAPTFVVRLQRSRRAHMGSFFDISSPIGIKISDDRTAVGRVAGEDAQPGERPRSYHPHLSHGRGEAARAPLAYHRRREAGLNVLWVTDPCMETPSRRTTASRPVRSSVRDEIMAFFEVHEQMGTHPGGVHLEMTGQDVTSAAAPRR